MASDFFQMKKLTLWLIDDRNANRTLLFSKRSDLELRLVFESDSEAVG